MSAAAPTPLDIIYETPSDMASTPPQCDGTTPRSANEMAEIPTSADESVYGDVEPLPQTLSSMIADVEGLALNWLLS